MRDDDSDISLRLSQGAARGAWRRIAFGALLLALSMAAAALGVVVAQRLLPQLGGVGLALLLDGALALRRGRSPLGDDPQAAAWLAILSLFLVVPFETLNAERGLWADLGWPGGEMVYLAAKGAWFLTLLPIVASAAALFGARAQDRQARLWLSAPGLALWAAAVWVPWNLEPARWALVGFLGLTLLSPRRRLQDWLAWSAAGLLWIGWNELLAPLAWTERIIIAPAGLGLSGWAALALVGPALAALYDAAVSRLGLPVWPPDEGDNFSVSIKI